MRLLGPHIFYYVITDNFRRFPKHDDFGTDQNNICRAAYIKSSLRFQQNKLFVRGIKYLAPIILASSDGDKFASDGNCTVVASSANHAGDVRTLISRRIVHLNSFRLICQSRYTLRFNL